jgi:transposase
VPLIPAQYVKPFVKRSKNDRADAAAINDAASRPDMPTVPVKSAEQQANTMIVRHRELLTGQRTAAINALRGHAAEFGIIAAKGTAQIGPLLQRLAADEAVPAAAKAMFVHMGEHIATLDQRIEALEEELLAVHKALPVSQRLIAVPGIGPITAITLALSVEPRHFASGRHFAAWLGLTPKEHSTGGKPRLGKISKAGNDRLRTLLVVGAMAVIRHARPGRKGASAWLLQLLGRKPRKLAAVALANKMARIAWAMMVRGEAYRRTRRSPPEPRAGAAGVRAAGDEIRSNRQAGHAVNTCDPVRSRGCLALACGSHLGQRSCGRVSRPDTWTLSTRSQSHAKPLNPRGRSHMV